MHATITLEVPAEHEAFVRRALAVAEELRQLALAAPDGTVLDTCEAAAVLSGRQLQTQLLQEAVARRVEAAEKRGRRSACAPAVGRRTTGGPRSGTSSAPSAS